jgi:hypothetical protein
MENKLKSNLTKTVNFVCSFIETNYKYRKLVLFIFLSIYTSHISYAQSVSTYAGTGLQGDLNGSVLTCEFVSPEQMAFDSKGNLYIADALQHVIRKIDKLGNVSNYTGNGAPGYVNGNISVAQFYNPLGIAIDKQDNIYISDEFNYVIRRIDTLGNVTTFAGSGLQGYTDSIGTLAEFGGTAYMCFDDSSNLYVADYVNNVIRKVDNLGNVSTFAGTGVLGNLNGPANLATFNWPVSIAYNKLQNVFYVSDRQNYLIRKIDASRNVSTYAGDGTAGHADGIGTSARFNGAKGIVTDSIGNLYIAGRLDFTIRKIDTFRNVTTIAGIPNVTGYVDTENLLSEFGRPISVVFDGNRNLLVSDYDNFVIRGVEVYSILLGNGLAQSTNSSFNLYPNPTNENFTIEHSTDQAEILITDILGQLILKIQTTQPSTKIQLDKNGVYLVYVKTIHGMSAQKLIVNR